jgi:predicted ATP-dependent serine protease
MITRAYCYEDIERINFRSIEISSDWKPHLGDPQLGNSHWLIYGESGQGKTSYVLQVVKMLCQTGHRVHYNTAEEGLKKSYKMALDRNNLKGVLGFNYQQESLYELQSRLSRRRQAKIVVIDSVQYFFRGMNSKQYFDFISRFKDTTFIWVSGAESAKPRGKIAEDIYYDADIVIHVKDFEAVVKKNRFEAYESRIIWDQGFQDKQLKLTPKG